VKLVVDPEIWKLYPEMRLVLVWAGPIDNSSARPELLERLRSAVEATGGGWTHPNPQSHPHIAAWREAIKASGFSGKKFPSSIEALTRRALSGRGVGSINPLVDLYNAVSLENLVPAGGWDLEDLGRGGESTLSLARARGGERFRELGSSDDVAVSAGEVAYLVGDEVATRHFVWRQSDLGKLVPETRRAVLVSEILGGIDDAVVARVHKALVAGAEQHFGPARSVVLTAGAAPLALDE
jgi:DNA/RNA-binding domain of Phe-tRNA-synthetase-like protein